ncbi:hypothetical protein Pen01_53800 [Phytomonospora endophytica]|nr:hypothetical protein Pen01_53800 [Phytomonospora endophytica]
MRAVRPVPAVKSSPVNTGLPSGQEKVRPVQTMECWAVVMSGSGKISRRLPASMARHGECRGDGDPGPGHKETRRESTPRSRAWRAGTHKEAYGYGRCGVSRSQMFNGRPDVGDKNDAMIGEAITGAQA